MYVNHFPARAYRGMGQGCDVLTDPTCGISSLQQTQLSQTLPGLLPSTAVSAGAMNWTPWLIGGGLLLVMLMARR